MPQDRSTEPVRRQSAIEERLAVVHGRGVVVALAQRGLPMVHAELGTLAHLAVVPRGGDDLLGGEAERQRGQ